MTFLMTLMEEVAMATACGRVCKDQRYYSKAQDGIAQVHCYGITKSDRRAGLTKSQLKYSKFSDKEKGREERAYYSGE